MEEYEIGPNGGKVEFACPACNHPIKLVVKREEMGTGRQLIPMTRQDVDQIQQMRRES